MLGLFKRAMSGAVAEVKADYSENKDFLEAVCAAAALVAYADGDLEDSEKQKVIKVVSQHPTLGKLYQQPMIEAAVETMFKRAKDTIGRQQLARELDDLKGRPDAAQMAEDCYLIAVDVALADGQMEPEEEVVLKKLAARLGVDLAKFDL